MTDTHEAHRLAKLLSADPTESPVSLAASALLLRIPELEAENAAWRKQADTLTHQVICCGVAASHPDPELTKHGAYAGKWNSAQAEEVRKLRAERDQLRAELENVRVPEGWKLVPVEPTREMLDRGSHNVNCNYHYGTMETIAKHAYKAMLTAAPTPPNADQKGQ